MAPLLANSLIDRAWSRQGAACLGLAFVITLIATPVVRRVAIRLDLVDRPDSGLKPHQRPIPYLGGVAIYAGWLAALIGAAVMAPEAWRTITAVAVAGSVMMLTGLVDDVRSIRPWTKLVMQALVAAVLLLGDVGGKLALVILDPMRDVLPAAFMDHRVVAGASGALTVALLLGATNAANLIDGLDGLCAGVTAVAALGFAGLSLVAGWDAGRGPAAVEWLLAAALLGACGAFLCYNFNPASIFMGDSGSLLLGFNAAVLVILIAHAAGLRGFVAAVTVFGFPILDTTLAVARRRRHGRPLFIGDRSHLYDQLRDRGLSVRRTVLVCYALGLLFAAAAAAGLMLTTAAQIAITAAVVAACVAVPWRLGMLRVDDAARRSSFPAAR